MTLLNSLLHSLVKCSCEFDFWVILLLFKKKKIDLSIILSKLVRLCDCSSIHVLTLSYQMAHIVFHRQQLRRRLVERLPQLQESASFVRTVGLGWWWHGKVPVTMSCQGDALARG